jgi:hypothetical protein
LVVWPGGGQVAAAIATAAPAEMLLHRTPGNPPHLERQSGYTERAMVTSKQRQVATPLLQCIGVGVHVFTHVALPMFLRLLLEQLEVAAIFGRSRAGTRAWARRWLAPAGVPACIGVCEWTCSRSDWRVRQKNDAVSSVTFS